MAGPVFLGTTNGENLSYYMKVFFDGEVTAGNASRFARNTMQSPAW